MRQVLTLRDVLIIVTLNCSRQYSRNTATSSFMFIGGGTVYPEEKAYQVGIRSTVLC